MTTVLPIVDRELRVAARKRSTYRLRFWVALATLLLWIILLKGSNNVLPTAMGQHLLNSMGILALTFCMFAGIFLTADCLSEEKREGTMGLLFLTDLKSYDVIFGKLAANSLHAFFGFLAVFPIFGLTLMMGGVTGAEFMRLSLVFVVTLFFSLGIGLAVSAAAQETRNAISGTLLVIVFLAGICPAVWWLYTSAASRASANFLLWPSPGYAYRNAFAAYYRSPFSGREFWHSIITLFGVGLGGIIFANVILPRSWQQTGERKAAGKFFRWPYFLATKPVMKLRDMFCEPMYWLAVRDGSPGMSALRVILILFPLVMVALMLSVGLSNQNACKVAFIVAFFSVYGLHFVTKVLIAAEASRRMNEDRRSGAWELLLVTPLRVKEILRGQRDGLRRQFRGALFALCLLNIILVAMVLIFPRELGMATRDKQIFCEIFLGGIVALQADFFGLSWVGMWRGLLAKQHYRAVLVALAQIILPPAAILFLLIFTEPFHNEAVLAEIIAGWFMLSLVISFFTGHNARNKLHQKFRSAVLGSQRAETLDLIGGEG